MEHSELFNSSFDGLGNSKPHSGHGAFTANRLLHTAEVLDYYYTPFLCFFGILGNCLSVFVFCSNTNYRSRSSSYYLSALAISDTGFLINLFAVWLDGMGVGLLATSFGCVFIMFSGQVTCFVSVWLTVAFTVERFFAVYSPLTRPTVCTVSKAKKVIFGLTTFALIAFSYVLLIAQVKEITIHDQQDPELTFDTRKNSTEGNLISHFRLPMSAGSSNINTPTSSTESECLLSSLVTENCGDGESQREQFLGSIGDSYSVSSELDTFPKGVRNKSTVDSRGFSSPSWINNSEPNITKRIINGVEIYLNQSDEIGNTPDQYILMCTVPPEYMTISTVANYLDSMITLIIPFCLITFFNMRIAVCVWKLKDQRMDLIGHAKVNNRKGHKTSKGIREHFNNIVKREVCQLQETKFGVENQGLYTFGSIIPEPSSSKTLESLPATDAKAFSSEDKFIKRHDYTNQASSSEVGVEISLNAMSATKGVHLNEEAVILESELHFENPPQRQPVSKSSHLSQSQSISSVALNGTGYRRGNQKFGGTTYSASESRVTKMLLLVSTVFIVLNLPSHAIRAASFVQRLLWEDDLEGQHWLHAAQQISNILLFNTNFAVNFLLYCLSGRNFRKSLWNIVFKRFMKKPSYFQSCGKSTVALPKTVRFGSRRNENESVTFDENTCIQ